MAKWAYKTVQFAVLPKDKRLVPVAVDRKLVPGYVRGPDYNDYLNELGAEGWELVAVIESKEYAQMGQGTPHLHIFKRSG